MQEKRGAEIRNAGKEVVQYRRDVGQERGCRSGDRRCRKRGVQK